MIDSSQFVVPGAAVLLAMLVLLVVLVVRRRQSDHAFTQALDERGERLALALWATGERYWDYHLPSGALRRLISVQRGDDGGLVEDTLQAAALIHPDDLGAARQALAACLDDAASRYHAVLRVSDGDAGWCWVRVRGRVIERDRAGAVVLGEAVTSVLTGRLPRCRGSRSPRCSEDRRRQPSRACSTPPRCG